MPDTDTAPYEVLFVHQNHGYPNPLPTPDDLDGSEALLNDTSKVKLARVQERFVMKFGVFVDPIEAHNMLFVEKSTTVPIPKVFANYQRPKGQRVITYILMQYVPGERTAHKLRYYQHVLPTHLRGNEAPVFTHNDFQRKNVMVRPDGTLVVIDWEFASWYPTYWEYATATCANAGWYDDWHEYVRIALDEYPNQSLWLSSMKHEMWG
ncbi:hypothetical protein PG996_008665 [Apiospora saccharicola]|uniref:Aminoglycoside phosphotransferase domain-containing protein n=1 Tax=Apiospora saccharicola TaxID=335842 RepID=A0ABR1UYL1_9PEZI